MKQSLLLICLIGVVVISARLGIFHSPAASPGHLGAIPAVSFTAQDGGEFKLPDRLLGRISILNLFFATCHGPCPAVMTELQAIQRRRTAARDLQFLSLSIDSETDSAESLTRYGADLGLPMGKVWHLLRGDTASVQQFAEQALHLGVELEAKVHSTSVALIDRKGELRGVFSILDPEGRSRLEAALDNVLAE